VEKCINYARQVNPQIQIFQVSATSGAGLEKWYGWLSAKVAHLSIPVSV
jgi:hydrogenase nickel incorporation protein HypB